MLLVTVSDDRFGRKDGKYAATQKRMEAIFRNNSSFGIDQFVMLNWDDIQTTQFYRDNQALLDNVDASRNGRAYKPFAIQQGLAAAADGDYVVYNDCSPELWPMDESFVVDPDKFNSKIGKRLCKENNGLVSTFVKWDTRPIPLGELGVHTHENFTTDRCIRVMGMEAYSKFYMHASGLMIFQKLPHVVAFVDEWLKWNCNAECSAFGDPNIPGDYSYWDKHEQDVKMGHRHDQSVSGLLINKYGYKLVDLPPRREGIPSYNLLNFFRTDTSYQYIDPNVTVPGRRLKKGDVLINAAGHEVILWEIRPQDGIEWLIVGPHRESCYRTTEDKLTLKTL